MASETIPKKSCVTPSAKRNTVTVNGKIDKGVSRSEAISVKNGSVISMENADSDIRTPQNQTSFLVLNSVRSLVVSLAANNV